MPDGVSLLVRAGFVPAGIGLAFSFSGSKSSSSKLELVVSRLIRSSELWSPRGFSGEPVNATPVRSAGSADDEGALASATSTLDWKDTVEQCKRQVFVSCPVGGINEGSRQLTAHWGWERASWVLGKGRFTQQACLP